MAEPTALFPALALVGDEYHPAGQTKDFLRRIAGISWRFDTDYLPKLHVAGRDEPRLLVLAKANQLTEHDPTPWLTDHAADALSRQVAAGIPLLVLHSGLVGYDDQLAELVGGRFVSHPPVGPLRLESTAPAELDGPLALTDEQYHVELTDGESTVFATLAGPDGEPRAAGWRRHYGIGRVCVLTPGHTESSWENPAFVGWVRAAIGWLL